MEEARYYAAIAVAIAFGWAGNRWARSMGHAVLLGLAGPDRRRDVPGPRPRLAVFSPMASFPAKSASGLGALLLFGSALGVFSAVGRPSTPRREHRLGCR